MRSTVLTAVDGGADQRELRLSRRASPAHVADEVVRVQPSFMAAIGLCISSSGLEDTEIVLTLEIDAGHWTRIKRGDAHFPPNKLVPLMELCGNDIPLRWLAMRCGYELRPAQSALERRLEEAEAARREAEQRLETITQFMRDTRGGR